MQKIIFKNFTTNLKNLDLPFSIVKNWGKWDRLYPIMSFQCPLYAPYKYYKQIAVNNYFHALLILRHCIKLISDYYFSFEIEAINVDLFMFTFSISSPMGPGSDSEAIKIRFGNLETYLVDSSQFGFEPILINHFNKVYCYLPSMRGENPDNRHLNQFFHCEAEIKGNLNDVIFIVERYIKTLSINIKLMDNIINRISLNPKKTKYILDKIISIDKFPQITFDEAINLLIKHKKEI